MTQVRSAPFALRVVQRKTGLAAIVYRRKADRNGHDRLQRLAAISPLAFTAATPLLREAVSGSENAGAPLRGKTQPFRVGAYYPLDADAGAWVACFSLIAAGLRDGERLDRAANHLRHADPNEAAWWLPASAPPLIPP
jgi:hypothetical protein